MMNQFESYILNKILDDKEYAIRLIKEDIGIFSQTMMQVHFGLRTILEKNMPITFMSVIKESNLQKHHLEDIEKTPSIKITKEKAQLDDFDYCIFKIKEAKKIQEMKWIAEDILKNADRTTDTKDLIGKAMERIGSLSNMGAEIQTLDGNALMDEFDAFTNDIEERKVVPSIRCDLAELNRVTAGFQFGDLVLLKGFTAAGKTALALHLAKAFGITQKIETVYINMEMSNKQLAGRLISSISQSDDIYWHSLLDHETYKNQNLKSEIEESKQKVRNSKLRLININFPTVNQVESLIREYNVKYGTQVFFVDYLQRMQLPKNNKEESWRQLVDVAKYLKTLAKSLNVIIVALVQVRTDGTTAGASYVDWESDLAFWIRKPEEADLEGFVNDYKLAEITRVIEFTKQRMGAENIVVPINFYGRKLQFFNVSKI